MTEQNENPDGDEDAAELFPAGSLEGDDKTRQTLYRKGLPTKVEVSIGKAAVPLTAGLLDPTKAGRSLVSWRYKKDEEVPQYKGGDGADRYEIESLLIRQHLTAVFVEDANEEAPLIRREFANLLELDASAAHDLLVELQAMAKPALKNAASSG